MGTIGKFIACVALGALLAGPALAQAPAAPPAPMARPTPEQFATPDTFSEPALSPSGHYVAGIRHEGTVYELVVIDLATKQSSVVQRSNETAGVRIEWVEWKGDDRLIIGTGNRASVTGDHVSTYATDDPDTDIYWVPRVIASSRMGGSVVSMFEGQARRIAGYAGIGFRSALPNDPDNILLEAYGSQGLTLWRTNVKTGVGVRVESDGWDTVHYTIDSTGAAVIRVDALPYNSGERYFRRGPGQRTWTKFLELKHASSVNSKEFLIAGPAAEPGKIYVAARQDSDFSAVRVFDTATGEYGPVLISNPRADIDYAMIDSVNHTLLAGCTAYQRYECVALDPAVRRHLRAVDQFFGGVANVVVRQMSGDQKVWLLEVSEPGAAPAYFIYDREAARIDALVATRAVFSGMTFPKTEVMTYHSRDGTELWGYLTNAPAPGAPAKALVVMPHGGPEERDLPFFDDWTEFLASRGYVVFRPNFRGGGGFGHAFAEAGHGQWGRRMQDDITDGVKQLISTGAVDPKRICIFGWSYGGYAALAGGALTPDLYRCVISGAGPSDLLDMLQYEVAQQGRGSASYSYWKVAIGDPSADRAALIAVSPRRQVQAFRAPVLLIHGTKDDTVPIDQSRDMEKALREAGKSVRLVELSHEWHSPVLRRSQILLYEELDAFLAANLPPN